MDIDNYKQAELVKSITVDAIASDGTYTTSAIVLTDAFGEDNLSGGGYVNTTTNEEDILVVRQFPINTIDDSNYNHSTAPITASEAWSVWTLPKTNASGSEMYTLNSDNTITFKNSAAVVGTTTTSVWEWTLDMISDAGSSRSGAIVLPSIQVGDVIHVFRKTQTLNKSIHFQPQSKLTAASLNTAIDQAYRLGQENYALWHNFCKLNPAVGNPHGVCPLNAKGLIDNKYVDGTLFLTADSDGNWDAKDMYITSVKDPSYPQNAVNKRYLEAVNNLTNYYNKTTSDGRYPVLNSDNKIPSSHIPDLAFSNYLGNAANAAALPTLKTDTSNIGDWATTEAGPATYVIAYNDGSSASDWVLVQTPTDKVITVNGESGAVELNAADVGALAGSGNGYTQDQVRDIATLTNFYNKTDSDARYIQTGAAFDDMEITATDGTTARDLDDHFADWINVKDFGAVGDGSTDDTVAIQAALDHLTNSTRGTVFFPYGTYKVTSTIHLRENNHLDLNGSTILFSKASTAAGDALFQTASGSIAATQTHTATTGFNKGDLSFEDAAIVTALGGDASYAYDHSLRIRSDANPWYFDDDGDTTRYIGEFNRLIDDGYGSTDNKLELANPLRYTYRDTSAGSTTITLEWIKTTKNIQIRNGILKDESLTTTTEPGGGPNNTAIWVTSYAEDVVIDNVTIEGFGAYYIRCEYSQNVKVTNCTFKSPRNLENIVGATYGVALRNGCENTIVDNCSFSGISRVFTGSADALSYGPSKDIRFTNNKCEYLKERWQFDEDSGHSSAGGTDYIGCNFWYSDYYIAQGNIMHGSESFGIYGLGGNAIINDNHLLGVGIEYPGGSAAAANSAIQYRNMTKYADVAVKICGNTIDTTKTPWGINVFAGEASGSSLGSGMNQGVIISNNTIRNLLRTNSMGIEVRGLSDSNKINGVIVEGNSIHKTHNGIILTYCTEGLVANNKIVTNLDYSNDGIAYPNSSREGILMNGVENGNVTGNIIVMNRADVDDGGSKNYGISLLDNTRTQSVLVSGNTFKGYRNDSGATTGANDAFMYIGADDGVGIMNNMIRTVANDFVYAGGTFDKKKIRTHGNFYYPTGDPNNSVGGHPWGKEMDTGFTPQIEVYTEGAETDPSALRHRPTQARFVTSTRDYEIIAGGSFGTSSIQLSNIGISTSDKILWAQATVHQPPGGTDDVSKVICTIDNYTVGANAPTFANLRFSTTDGTSINTFNDGTLTITTLFLVADSIDTDGGS